MADFPNDGGPAFPRPPVYVGGARSEDGDEGMSLRDYFAGQALPGLLSNPDMDTAIAVTVAYQYADQMLRRRAKVDGVSYVRFREALNSALLMLEVISENWGGEHPGLKETADKEIVRLRAVLANA